MTIPVYKQEILDNVSELVKANTSIAYTSPILKLEQDLAINEELISNFVKANSELDYNRFDLFPIYSLLVSTGINKNDDFFLPDEVWAARHTPEDKPLNLNHRQLDIIGHITSNHAVDENFNSLAKDIAIDELPSLMHIITTSVVYRFWEDRNRQREVAQIIDEIENSNPAKHYVSMECIFKGIGYVLTNNDGVSKIIERNESTAGLTKHLRAYGGTGSYEGYRIGRVLRNITFSGHGIVGNPANEASVIFDRNRTFNFSNANLGYINSLQINNKETIMPEVTLANIETLITELRSEFTTANLARIHSLEAQIDALKKGQSEHQTHIDKHVAEKAALENLHQGQMNAVTAELTEAKDKLEKMEKAKEEDEKTMCTVKAENEAYKKTLDEYKKASKKTEREKALLKTKIKAEAVEKTLESFASLDDETFNAIVQTFAMDDDEKDEDDSQADFGAKPIDGEATTTPSTKTENVDQFGKTHPENVMGNPHPSHADVIATASVDSVANLGVSTDNKSIAKVQADVLKFLSKGKKVKGE